MPQLDSTSSKRLLHKPLGIKDLENLRAEIDTTRVRQGEQREELERLVAQRTTYYEDYRRKQSELQNINRSLSRIQKEATTERLLPGPKSTARLAVLAEEIRQLSEALTKVTDSANEITQQPAEPNND
jgi:predicted  nucleic acid-binding Zn-ribbon protein